MDERAQSEIEHALSVSEDGSPLDFFRLMPGLSREVQLKVLEQLPEFRKLAGAAIDGMRFAFKEVVRDEAIGMDHLHRGYEAWRSGLLAQMARSDLNFEQMLEISDRIGETLRQQGEHHSDHRKFIDAWYGKALAGVGVASLAVVAFFFVRKDGGGSA